MSTDSQDDERRTQARLMLQRAELSGYSLELVDGKLRMVRDGEVQEDLQTLVDEYEDVWREALAAMDDIARRIVERARKGKA